jgi:hypothetical protein
MRCVVLSLLVLGLVGGASAGKIGVWEFDDSCPADDGTGTYSGKCTGSTALNTNYGVFGDAYEFTGDGDVYMSNNSEFSWMQNGKHATVTMWVRPQTESVTEKIVAKQGEWALQLTEGSAGDGKKTLDLVIWSGSTGSLASDTVPLDEWTFLAFRFDENIDVEALKDGSNSIGTVSVESQSSTHPFSVGSRHNSAGSYDNFDGFIDATRVYDRLLTGSEIDTLYNQNSLNNPPQFNSTSVSPDPPLIGKNVSASFSVSDSDGSVSEVLVEVFESGTEVASRTQSYSSSSVSDTFSDLYNINDANYTFYYTVTDNDGAQSVTTIERQAEEPPDSTPPNISYNPDTTDSGTHSQSWIFANYSASDNENIGQVLSELGSSNTTVTNSANGNYWINHTGLSDGTYSLQGWANDTAANWNSTGARSITLDTTPPTTSDNYSKSGWQDLSEVSVELTATDSASSVANLTYSVDGGTESTVNDNKTSLTISGDGNHTIDFYAFDSKGNKEAVQTEYVALDTQSPTLSSNASDGWKKKDSEAVGITASDSLSGPSQTSYRINGGTWTISSGGSATASPSGNGNHTIEFNATDGAGNTASIVTDYSALDTEVPSTSLNDTVTTWLSEATRAVAAEAVDSYSGVGRISYRVDGGSWSTESGTPASFNVSGDGNHTVEFNATDNVGNTESVATNYVELDDTAPSQVSIGTPENVTYQDQTTIDLNATGSDATSGIGTWYYSKDGGSYQQFTPNTSLTYTDGQHTVEVRAQDRASNNASTSVSFYVNVTLANGYVKTVPPGKAVSLRSDPSRNLSKFSNAVEGVQDIVFGDGLGSNLSAQLRVNISEANVTADNLVFETNRTEAKSVVHNTSSVANLKQKSLLIPRIENTGKVHICPGAENLSSIGLNCSNGYNISSGETVNGVSLSEASISGQDYYEAEGINGTGGVEVAAASSSGGGGEGSGGSDDSSQNASVVFSTPRFELLPGTEVSETVRITNREPKKNTVDVSVPDTPSCKPVKLREGLNTGGFAQKASYTLEPNQTVSTAVQLAMPENASTGFECTLDAEASQGKADEFTVVVEKQSNPLAFLDNGWPISFCRDVSLDTLETGRCENEVVEKFTVGHALLLGFLSAAAIFLYRVT